MLIVCVSRTVIMLIVCVYRTVIMLFVCVYRTLIMLIVCVYRTVIMLSRMSVNALANMFEAHFADRQTDTKASAKASAA